MLILGFINESIFIYIAKFLFTNICNIQCNLGISQSLESNSYFGIVITKFFFCLFFEKRGISEELNSKDFADK